MGLFEFYMMSIWAGRKMLWNLTLRQVPRHGNSLTRFSRWRIKGTEVTAMVQDGEALYRLD